MLKKILTITALCAAISTSAFAQTDIMVEKGDKYQFMYPRFVFADTAAAERANDDIKVFMDEMREDINDPMYLELNTYVSVIRETEHYVNVTLVRGVYTGGAHGMSNTKGLVYSKATGSRLPYDFFVPKVEKNELLQGIKNGTNLVYTADMKTISDVPLLTDEYFNVSENYILADDGYLYLMYQPYELDCYAAGTTYVRIGKYKQEAQK